VAKRNATPNTGGAGRRAARRPRSASPTRWRSTHGFRAGVAAHEAWDAALDVERAELDPRRGQWDERALEYRPIWESRFGASGRRWEDHEAGYRFADAMALDPRYLDRPWDDAAPGLEAAFPAWAASHRRSP
jgi:hypothetical protein